MTKPGRPARQRLLAMVGWAMVTFGAWQAAGGAYLHAKAMLAQVLLRHAWASTVDDAGRHRPWAWADTWPVGRLRAPSQGIDQIVLSGVGGNSLAFGPGRLPRAGGFDGAGPIVLAGHRDTHFRFLEHLRPGDLLLLDGRRGRSGRFRVQAAWVVDETDTDVIHLASESTLLLITCYPFDTLRPGGPLRFVVRAARESA